MTFTLSDLRKIVLDRDVAAVVATSDLVPTAGRGARIAPATYAGSSSKAPGAFAGGVALTDNALLRTVADDGTADLARNADGTPRTGPVAVVDSVSATATRAENALWALRDELDLPGIVYVAEDDEVVAEAVDAALSAATKSGPDAPGDIDTSELASSIARALDPTVAGVSSWTLSHRHVDGAIRHGLVADTGDHVWDGHGDLYRRIISAGPRSLLDLLTLSPNSVLYGFWLASGAPVAHKLPRSITSEIIGYDARRTVYGATRAATWEAHSDVYTDDKGNLSVGKAPKGYKKPSELGVSAVPSSSENTVVCSDIIGTATLSLSNLRRTLAASSDMSDEQRDAAAVALAALGMLGHLLTLDNGYLRSGCDLVDETTVWETVGRRGARAVDASIPVDAEEFLPVAREALDAARGVGAFGSAADRVEVRMSERLRTIFVTSYAKLALGASAGDEA